MLVSYFEVLETSQSVTNIILVQNTMLMTNSECWSYWFVSLFHGSMLMTYFYNISILVTWVFHVTWTVTNIQKLSSTDLVSNNRHQYRCSRQSFIINMDGLSRTVWQRTLYIFEPAKGLSKLSSKNELFCPMYQDIQHRPWNSTLWVTTACERDFYVFRSHMDSTPKS